MEKLKNFKNAPELKKIREKTQTIEADIEALQQSIPVLVNELESVKGKRRSVAVAIELGKAKPKAINDLDSELKSAKSALENAREFLEVKQLTLEQLKLDYQDTENKVRDRLKKAFDKEQEKLIDDQCKAFREFLSVSEKLKELEADALRAEIPAGRFGFDIKSLRSRHQPRLPFWMDRMNSRGKLPYN